MPTRHTTAHIVFFLAILFMAYSTMAQDGFVLDLTKSRWLVSGTDIVPWTGKMVFDEHDLDNTFSGHFNWITPAGSQAGREWFTGTFDPNTFAIDFQGYALECQQGIGICTYNATVLPDGTGMIEGTWGGGCVSGNWTAEADPCPDLSGDNTVGVTDLLALLIAWGECAEFECPLTCPQDINADGAINVNDLLILLAEWGC